jgi:3-hydroxybutyryl-CoA dehydratase
MNDGALKMNQEIKPVEIVVDKYCPFYYAGASGDFNLIHIDNEFAKSVGLPGIILQGLCTMAFVCRAAIGNNNPKKLKKIKVRFRNIVRPLDTLSIAGKVSNTENNLATFDLVVKNQRDEDVITNAQVVVLNA